MIYGVVNSLIVPTGHPKEVIKEPIHDKMEETTHKKYKTESEQEHFGA